MDTAKARGDLTGKIAIVTGGSSGIGAAAVRELAAAGATVVIGYNRGEDRAEALRASLGGQERGKEHCIQQIRNEDGASVRALADMVRTKFGKADILVNSGGFTRPVPHGDLETLSDELFDSVLLSNLRGPFSVIRAMAPLLKAGGNSVIVNVSSISAFTGSGSSIAYVASKAGLEAISMSLARVLGPEIRVMCVSPGAVATDFVAGRGRADLEKMAATSPLRRVTEPEDVAAAIMACVTHLSMTTGVRIVVDGGRFL
jgi:3-oxoacyl-[acyl-carrier protein] reductase